MIKDFIKKHYRHFNASALTRAVKGYKEHLNAGGKMFLAMGGAMSTAELGISLGEMIRQDKIHGISTTGANLEEDIFNLVARDFYKLVPDYRSLTAKDEEDLYEKKMNRVTDTCIPEDEAMRRVEKGLLEVMLEAEEKNGRYFPWEFIFELIRSGRLKEYYQIDPKDSWVVAAAEKNIPVYTPGWEDSTLGNSFVADVRLKKLKSLALICHEFYPGESFRRG